MKLSILIPMYNAEETIRELCNELLSLYSRLYQLEIVLVNDGSTDGTDSRCKDLCEEHPDVIIYIRLSRNFGEHSALMAGIHYVTGDYCIMMDDDFQNPPGEVFKLVSEIQKGFDVVYSYYPSRQDSFFRRTFSRIHNRMATLILKKPADLYLSSFKIINRFLIEEIRKYTGPDPYVDGIILRSTDNFGRVPVVHHERRHSESGYTLGKLFSLWGNMIISFSLYPLRILAAVGAVVTLIGIVDIAHTALDLVTTAPDPTQFERFTSFARLFRGIQLLAVGIVGEYVGRIYKTLNKVPQFVIREIKPAARKYTVSKVSLIR